MEVRGGGDGGGSGAARHLGVAAGADGGASCNEGLVAGDDLIESVPGVGDGLHRVGEVDLLPKKPVGMRVSNQIRVLLLAQVGRRAQPTVALDVDLVRGGRRPAEVEEGGVREEWQSGRAGGTNAMGCMQLTLASSTSAPSSL